MGYAVPMAWDTAATRHALLEAGARQFSRHGFAGARMDAIGVDAGVNKERVYQYFGNKRGLFDAVLADRLGDLLGAAGSPAPGSGPRGVGEYAGALFDRFAEHPELARLLAWESLELEDAADANDRAANCAVQARALSAALPGLSVNAAPQLLLSVVSLCASWWALGRIAEMIAPAVTVSARRAEIVAQAILLAEATQALRAETPSSHTASP